MRWALVGALTWLGVMALFVVAVQRPARAPRVSAANASRTTLARSLAPPHVGTSYSVPDDWIVLRANSALRSLVVELEADRPEDARRIAEKVVKPVRTKYDTILIYVRRAGSPAGSSVRRVEWTPTRGFIETSF